ncbi:type IV pilus biogenesis/stability protein PilW [Aestuariirhabdus litorea]|uniref:Type IV pilus biogenesis/stability protein PilW n=1 Tax=Aestuariirhabdus litorea TaxID=2528527 RepID=A0A3P3VL03_9GAMM|nr:type IV pilus biogenesis/stability protein PilW [Aestuariirhabdus litorea]RRJ83422.1 type IV pilus biogenesis/stability protein PilW [Aestuariirhabdus litorea]RWW93583.1 type IV pilus biogenesis/stability protein PilW [Endozoicomonadaceae bacterium GTF-13]
MRSNLAALAVLVLLGGCVTHEYGYTPGRDADPEKELADNIRLAKAYIQEGYTVRAIEPLNRALELDRRSAEAYSVLAIVYQIEGDHEQARYNYERALSINSNASDIQHNFGSFLYRQQQYKEAISHLLVAAENIRYTRRSISFQVLGLCELKLGNEQKAEEYFLRAVRLERGLPVASLELAELYYNQRRYNEALGSYERFLEFAAQTSRSLLLGIRLARVFSDKDREASYALQLGRFFPGSEELAQYEEMKAND